MTRIEKIPASIVVAFFVLTILVSAAFAVPQTINYQGYIKGPGGAPVNDTVSIVFSIYNASYGGSALWTETQSSVAVTDGAFSVALGSMVPIDLPFDEQYYLGVNVNGDGEMDPRAVLVSVPYAFTAAKAENVTSGGVVPSGFSILGDTPTPPPGYTYTGDATVSVGAWATKAPMPTARDNLAAAVVNGKVYAIGGYNGVSYSANNEEYDPATDTWATKAPMPTARVLFAASAVGGKVYAIGGWDGSLLTTNEEYDPGANTWDTKTPMPTARYYLATAALGGKIYALGGFDDVPQFLATNEEYDPGTNTWATKADMPTARYGLATAAVGGKVYAIGGWDGSLLTTNEEYDPGANTWATKTPMPTARSGLAAAAVNGRVYAIGGLIVDVSQYLATNEEYDPGTNTWATKASMPTSRAGLAAAVVNGKVYAIGGSADGLTFFATNEEYDPGLKFIHTKD